MQLTLVALAVFGAFIAEQQDVAPGPTGRQVDLSPSAPASTDPVALDLLATGQWRFTEDFGWRWASYDRGHEYTASVAGQATEYVYYPTLGWREVAAAWILGLGVDP